MTPTNPISDTAFAILVAFREGKTKVTRKAGNFLGECVVDPSPLSEKQAEWLNTLAERAGVPVLDPEEVQ